MTIIYGHEIDLEEPRDGMVVVDVIVLAREVHTTSDGRLEDRLLISPSRTTTGMVQRGMIHESLAAFQANEEYGD